MVSANAGRRPTNPRPRTSNREHGTLNRDPRTQNRERGTQNREPRTRNLEPRTPNTNPEPGTRNPEPAIAVFAPATVSNVGCGFDVLGFALEQPGDVVVAVPSERDGVELIEMTGDNGRLPRDLDRNTATVAAAALLEWSRGPEGLRHREGLTRTPEGLRHRDQGPAAAPGRARGVGLIVRKGLPPASGIGSSGASAVAAVVAVDAALGLGAPPAVLLRSAMEGERVAAGAPHPDNAAPALFGGFVLARAIAPPDIVSLPVPAGLACAVLHPAIEIATRDARALLPATVPLGDAVRQWANVGALVAALYQGDFALLGRAMVDHVVEPKRAHLVPGFAHVTRAAREAGAIGAGLSGAGPSIFALCRSLAAAERAGAAMLHALRAHGGIDGELFVSRVSAKGARRVPDS